MKVILPAIIVLLILAVIVSAERIDYKVEEELETKEEVPVVVMLNDDVSLSRGFSALSEGSNRELLEERLNERKRMVKRQQENVLSELKLKEEGSTRGIKKVLPLPENYDFELKHSYSAINGFSGNITREGLEKLRNNPNVARVYYDDIRHLDLSVSVQQINANDVWALQPNGSNLTGLGQTVCVVDSGVDYRHPNLGNCSTENFTSGNCGKVLSGWDYVNDDNDPRDDHGHGTHVAGIVASNHTTNRGVAPDAKLVALKVCDNSTNGVCTVSDIISGIDWCINNKTKFNISIITMSIGGGTYSSSCDYEVDANASNVAVANGLFVSIATGNNGCSGTGCTTKISAPACASNVTAVGSVDSSDDIVSTSNRAPFNTIFAPGGSITSTVPQDSATTITDSSGFKAVGGTSMATPHIAGVAALMLQFNSSLSPLEIRKKMNDTGKIISDSGTIYKRVDALAAIQDMDTIPPIWSSNATNNTAPKKNDVVQFNITWNDTIGLSFYFFSWNDTGAWVNASNGTLSGTSQSISINHTVTATRGKNVYWKFYCNDTNNNWNMTDEWNFTVQNTIPTVGNLTLNSTDRLNRTNGSLVAYFDYSDVDNDANTLNETRWYNSSNHVSDLDNLTLVSSGNLSNGDVWLFSVRVYDGYNWSVWYNSSNISITNNAPNKPILNFSNNSIIRVNYTLLNWTATDDDGNIMACYVYGDNTSNPTSLINVTTNIANGSSSAFNWTNLNETTYYWKVQCDDGIENSSNSTIYQFTVAIVPTTYPTLFSVADYDSDGNIEINWSDDGNETGESYRIYRHTSNITSINNSVKNLTSGISAGIQFFEDNTTRNGTTYFYVLVTVDSEGNYNDSVFSNCLNGTANDTITPKTVTNLNVTGSGDTATLRWYNVSRDINLNADFHLLQYVVYYGTNFNSSKALANESITGYSTTTISANYTAISVTSSGTYHFIVTTLDDGNNANLTLDYANNYGNASLTYTPPTTSSSGGGSSGGGGGGGGGGGHSKKTSLDIKPEFTSGSGYTAKQTQGDEATFTINSVGYTISIDKLKSDSVTINIAGASSVFKEGNVKEFDVDSDGGSDVSITLNKITGGSAEIVYRMLARPKEAAEEKEPEKAEQKAEEKEQAEDIKKEKAGWLRWFLFISVSVLVFLIVMYIVLHKAVKKSPE